MKRIASAVEIVGGNEENVKRGRSFR